MKDRLTVILNENKLTAWKFAEMIGIQPSSLSHIFSGRNRASLDLVEKVLKQFPLINPDWLLFGQGDMYRTQDNGRSAAIYADMQPQNSNRSSDYNGTPQSQIDNLAHSSINSPQQSGNHTIIKEEGILGLDFQQEDLYIDTDRSPINIVDNIVEEVANNSVQTADTSVFTNVKQSDNQTIRQEQTDTVFTNVNTASVQDLVPLLTEKEIETITIFYTDSTFKVYKMSK